MTNPYLHAAEQVMGQDLQNAVIKPPGVPVPNPSRVVKQQVTNVYVPQPGLIQQPELKAISPKVLPQDSPIAPNQLAGFAGLSGFSKIRKMVFLALVGAGFAASKLFIHKYEVLLLAEHPEFKELKQVLPKADKVLLPATALFAFPVTLALFTDKEWPMLGWICWLGAIAYALKETGPGVIGIIRETKTAANDYKETKLTAARKRSRKKRARK